MFDRITRGQGKTALVQVCDENTILLVQVAKMKSELVVLLSITCSLLRASIRLTAFPPSLKAFIEDPTKIKLGVQIGGESCRSNHAGCLAAVLTW